MPAMNREAFQTENLHCSCRNQTAVNAVVNDTNHRSKGIIRQLDSVSKLMSQCLEMLQLTQRVFNDNPLTRKLTIGELLIRRQGMVTPRFMRGANIPLWIVVLEAIKPSIANHCDICRDGVNHARLHYVLQVVFRAWSGLGYVPNAPFFVDDDSRFARMSLLLARIVLSLALSTRSVGKKRCA